jgi:hypothetical protein
MLKLDIVSHNIPGLDGREVLNNSEFIVYLNKDRFRIYFKKYNFNNIVLILNNIFNFNILLNDQEDNKLLKIIFGDRHKLVHLEMKYLTLSTFLKLVIGKEN